jgi:hypothetical protein
MRVTGSDVKTATTTSSATGGASLISGRSRLRGYIIAGGSSDGTRVRSKMVLLTGELTLLIAPLQCLTIQKL